MTKSIKNILFTCCLLFVVNNTYAQTYNLKTKIAETDLKIICDSVYFFMDRKDVIAILKKMEKAKKVKYTMPIKKMNGVCFEAINLRKPNEDKDIALVQQLFLTDIIEDAIESKKIAIKWKKANQCLLTVQESNGNVMSCGTNSSSQHQFHNITDENGTVIFKIN